MIDRIFEVVGDNFIKCNSPCDDLLEGNAVSIVIPQELELDVNAERLIPVCSAVSAPVRGQDTPSGRFRDISNCRMCLIKASQIQQIRQTKK